jgi:predicted deacylase
LIKKDIIFLKIRLCLPFFIILFLLLQLLFSLETIAVELSNRTETVICKGTDYQTVAYTISSERGGPTIMIMSGVHGDELAGIEATKELIKTLEPERGTVIVIPEVNKEACKNRVRTMPSEEDLNRIYPGDSSSQGINKLAGEIFAIMQENKIDFLLDLHESMEYYKENPSHYGQTIILDVNNNPFLQEISDYLAKQLNLVVALPENHFEVIVKPIEGSSTYEALNRYEIPGITFETCRKIEFNKRVSFHYSCIQNILIYFNIISLSM